MITNNTTTIQSIENTHADRQKARMTQINKTKHVVDVRIHKKYIYIPFIYYSH